MLNQVALVSQTKHVTLDDLTVVSAALQKQVSRDLGPIWDIQASVDPFSALKKVPLGYWAIVIRDDIHQEGAAGIHLNKKDGQPFALVQYDTNWALTTSHECLEMLVDPSGNRTVAGNSVRAGQGRVQYLVEVCDASENAKFGYTLNGVLLSDFYTPQFFDPVAAAGVRYSFTGAVTKPRQVLDGGYLSWFDPISGHLFQQFVTGKKSQIKDQGALPEGFGSLRSFSDRSAEKVRKAVEHKGAPKGIMLTASVPMSENAPKTGKSPVDESTTSWAATLQTHIDALVQK